MASFLSISDVARCAQVVYTLYTYGWSSVRNASAQYNEFGQDVYRLYENLGQLDKIFQTVRNSTGSPIPRGPDFFDTTSLDSILDEPLKTINECDRLLRKRSSFSEDRGAIMNIYWNMNIEAEVTQLHERIKFHNVKIVALLGPLEMKLLLDIRSVVQDYGEAMLTRLEALEAKLFGATEAPPPNICVRCDQVQIPQFLTTKFQSMTSSAKPELQTSNDFPLRDGINTFLVHHKEDATASTFSGGFILQPPTQSPEQYLRLMKTIWIIRSVQACQEYVLACQSGNRLLKCFVEELANKCLREFNRFADRPINPFRVRNEPTEANLNPLGEDAFLIWPKVPQPLDRFDAAAASVDQMKTLLRAQMHNQFAPSRRMELLLIRHDSTLLEMIIKETSETDQATDSRSRDINLKIVSLNPIYADPASESPSIDLGLYTVGNRGRDDLLRFISYNDLYQFQYAITGYRPIIDLLNIKLIIQQDRRTEWNARIQLWNAGDPSNTDQTSPSVNSNRRLSDAPSSPLESNNSTSAPSSKYSSTSSRQTSTTEISTITSLMESSTDGGSEIDAQVFQPPKQPLLVLFLRPRRQKSPQPNHMSLMKIPVAPKSAHLDTKNCSCTSIARPQCPHSEITGMKKAIGSKPLMAERVEGYSESPIVNLAVLGAHHEMSGKQVEQKLNFVSFEFKSSVDKKEFDGYFKTIQHLYKIKVDTYDREKVAIRFQGQKNRIQKERRCIIDR